MMFHRFLVVLVLTVQWLATEGCLWCDPKMTSRFTNCLFLEIVSDPSLDVLERDMLVDMKSSLYSASKSMSKSSGPMKESIMNGALAGELSGMIASHSAATGQDPAVATSEVMALIGRCYFSVTQQSEVHFVKTLKKAVEDLVVDEMNDDSDYGSGGDRRANGPPQNVPNGRDVPSKEPFPNSPPNSQQSSASAIASQNSGFLPPARNPNPAPRIPSSEINTPYNVNESSQSNGIPPPRDNPPVYPPRTNQDNYRAEAFAFSNTGINDRAWNDGIQPYPNDFPPRTNGNVPAPSGTGVSSENLDYNNRPDFNRATKIQENVPFYPPSINLPPPSNSNVPQPSKGFMSPPAPREVPSDAKLPLADRNFQDSGIRQFNQNTFANPPPQQNWENQSPPAKFQGAEVSVNKFSNNIPPPSMDGNFGPNNNRFVYPIHDKNFNNQAPPSETRVPENQGNQYPLPFPNREDKPVGVGSGPQLPPIANISPNNENNNAQTNGFSKQTFVADSSRKDIYPDYQSNSYSSTNQNSGFPNGNFQGYIDGSRNQYADSSVSNQYDYQKDAVSIRNPTLLNQTPNQPSKGLEIPPQNNNYNFNSATGTQQLSSSNFNSPVSSAAKSDNQNVPIKQPLPENRPNDRQVQYPMDQNAWNVNAPTSYFEGAPKLQPSSSETNSGESYWVNKNENCAKTFYQTLLGKLLETNELSSILGTNSIPLLVKDSVAEATRRTFIDIGYSAYSDEVSNYCAIQIASLTERSGTQAYAEKITKSVTDVLLKNNALVRNCADGAKSVALHILRWLEVFFKSDEEDFNRNSSSASGSSSSGNGASQSTSSMDNKGDSGSSAQDNVNDYDYSYYDYENCNEDDDEQQDSSSQDNNTNGGDDDCEDQQPESSSSPDEDEDCDDDEQETTSPNESTDVDEDCEDEQRSSSPNDSATDDCDDEQSESSSQPDNTSNDYSNDDETSASDQQNDKESVLSNYESKNQIELLMSSARLSMSPNGFNLPGFVSVMSSVADQMGIDHPDWDSNKVQVKTFTQSLVALTLVLQDLAYPNSK